MDLLAVVVAMAKADANRYLVMAIVICFWYGISVTIISI